MASFRYMGMLFRQGDINGPSGKGVIKYPINPKKRIRQKLYLSISLYTQVASFFFGRLCKDYDLKSSMMIKLKKN